MVSLQINNAEMTMSIPGTSPFEVEGVSEARKKSLKSSQGLKYNCEEKHSMFIKAPLLLR